MGRSPGIGTKLHLPRGRAPATLLLAAIFAAVVLSPRSDEATRSAAFLVVHRSGDRSPQSLAVPAYFYPGSEWARMDHDHPPLRIAVMNPDSGPGHAVDPKYVSAVKAAQAAGILVLGYVYTDYALRPISEVEADIDSYYSWYHANGIFFDQASTNCADEPYYATLNSYVKGKGGVGRTVLNPGTQTRKCYEPAVDVLLTFEGSDHAYLHSYSAPKWVYRYPARHFWHVIYATTSKSALASTVELSEHRNAGFTYVTPLTLPNPYKGLPPASYWRAELTDIAR